MKKLIVLIISILILPLFAFTYTGFSFIEKLTQSLAIFNARYPEEKIYISSDKSFYKPGETIWLSIFALNGSDNRSSVISDMVHVELINPKDKVEKELFINVKDGMGKADFLISENMNGGLYKVRAYSKYMQLLNPKNCFEKTLQVQSVLIPKILMKLEFDRKAYGFRDTVVAALSAKSIENEPLVFQEYAYTVMLDGEKLYTQNEQLNDSGCAKIRFVLPKKLNTNDGILRNCLNFIF